MLRTHQILEIPGAIGNMTDDTPILINRTILMFCRYSDMNELLARYRSEDVLEGQQKLALQEAEEEENRGSEEDIHTSLSE